MSSTVSACTSGWRSLHKGEAVDPPGAHPKSPIRALWCLTYFGDMDISELRQKPAGRHMIRSAQHDRCSAPGQFEQQVVGVGEAVCVAQQHADVIERHAAHFGAIGGHGHEAA